jgi:fructan beta-fructosidase
MTLTLSGTSKKYLILTIDETTDSQEIYRSSDAEGNVNDIRLIREEGHYNHIYEVPYEIKNAPIIYINKASKDWVVWNYLRTSDTYDDTNRETIYRPGYHHTPKWGWMNDPNGLVFDGTYYHLFYQYNPYSSWWDNMAWGHSRSKNLLIWDHRPVAIERFEGGNIFSGSVVNDVDKTALSPGTGGLIAYFTVRGHFPVEDLWYQHNWAAYSKDREILGLNMIMIVQMELL